MNEIQEGEKFDYRIFLRHKLEHGRGGRGMMAELARAARVHPTMISHVFHHDADLSPEQALRLAVYLQLDEEETERFFHLVMHARAGTEEARQYFRRKLETKKSGANERAKILSHWLAQALYRLLPETGEISVGKLAQRLRKSEPEVESALGALKRNGHAIASGTGYRQGASLRPENFTEEQLSLAAWRAFLRERESGAARIGLEAAGAVVCSAEDIERLRALFLDWLSRVTSAEGKNTEPETAALFAYSIELAPVSDEKTS